MLEILIIIVGILSLLWWRILSYSEYENTANIKDDIYTIFAIAVAILILSGIASLFKWNFKQYFDYALTYFSITLIAAVIMGFIKPLDGYKKDVKYRHDHAVWLFIFIICIVAVQAFSFFKGIGWMPVWGEGSTPIYPGQDE